ncbi:TPA: hypothetical protein ACYR9U_004966, partial [Citrobacter freundii]
KKAYPISGEKQCKVCGYVLLRYFRACYLFFAYSAIKKRTGGTALCVGFIAEELKPQGICLSCILGITVAV